jgi:hypothetical protein
MPLVVSVDLDAVTVRVGHLNAPETPVVLPLCLDNARCPEALVRGSDGSLVRQPEAEVVRLPRRPLPLLANLRTWRP